MIRIQYVRRGTVFQMEAQGHANAAPRGQDLVCCGVSVLVQSLAQRVLDMYAEGQLKDFPDAVVKPDGTRVAVRARPRTVLQVEQAFAVVLTGLRMLCRQYPGYIEIFESYP